jgi:hypothetical protein
MAVGWRVPKGNMTQKKGPNATMRQLMTAGLARKAILWFD